MTSFSTSHDQAFLALGAKAPGQQWSAFDVSTERARAGEAKFLITTVWNFHHYLDAEGHRVPNENGIAKDINDGTLWYRIDAAEPGVASKTHVAHVNRFRLAFEQKLPIIGVLKDVKTKKCSLENLFDCVSIRRQIDKAADWVQLRPRGAIGCDTRVIDIGEMTGGEALTPTLQAITAKLEFAVELAMRSTRAERSARLALASKTPRKVVVTSYAYERNADVVAEVLLRARGTCEVCKMAAPFLRRKDGAPYLEVHHRKPLAEGGEDTVENALAACPNCHRKKHYG